ncbi:MAG: hypothetical protein N3A53_04745, partial [Verrucomicrobiae bacterium]|nr:hypothetical protein [Verrucomicrobiae bacterium]
KFYAYAFRTVDRASVVVAWAAPGQSFALGETPGLEQTDFLGNPLNRTTLNSSPIVFVSDRRVSPRQALERVLDAISY